MGDCQDLKIMKPVLDDILRAATDAGPLECMGLLASEIGDGSVITAACRLPAHATRSNAESDPVALRQAAESFRARRQCPVGLWHSHGNHGVFHSATDDHTVVRLVPAMAEWSFQRPPHLVSAPTVTEPDSALIPLIDGRWLRFILKGPPIPGMPCAHERAAWENIEVRFTNQKSSPKAIYESTSLRLVAGGVELDLGIPEGSAIVTSIQDPATVRIARLFSLVVNRRGDQYAESVTVHDLHGELYVSKRPCSVAVAHEPEGSLHANSLLEPSVDAGGMAVEKGSRSHAVSPCPPQGPVS